MNPFVPVLLEVCSHPPHHNGKKVIEAMGRMFDSGLDYENVDAVLDYLEYEALSGADNEKTNVGREKNHAIITPKNGAVQQRQRGTNKAIKKISQPVVLSTAGHGKTSEAIGLQPPRIPIDATPQHPPPSVALRDPVKEGASDPLESTRPLSEALLETGGALNVSSNFVPISTVDLSDRLSTFLDWVLARNDEKDTIFSRKSKCLENLMQNVLRGSRILSTVPSISSQILSLCSMIYHPHTLLAFAARDFLLCIARDILYLASKVLSEQGNSEEHAVEQLAGVLAGPVANILCSARCYRPPLKSRIPASGSRDKSANTLLLRLVNLEEKYFAMSAAEAAVCQRLQLRQRPYANPTAVTVSGTNPAGHITQDSAALESHLSKILKFEGKSPKEFIPEFRQQDVIDAELEALRARKKELVMALDEVNVSIAISEEKREALRHGTEEANADKSHQARTPDEALKALIADLTAMESELNVLLRGSIALIDTNICPQSSSPLQHYLLATDQWLSSQTDLITTLNFRVSEAENSAKDLQIEIENYRDLGMYGIVDELVLKSQKLEKEINEDRTAIEAFKALLRDCSISLVKFLVKNEEWRNHSTLLDHIVTQFNSVDIPTSEISVFLKCKPNGNG